MIFDVKKLLTPEGNVQWLNPYQAKYNNEILQAFEEYFKPRVLPLSNIVAMLDRIEITNRNGRRRVSGLIEIDFEVTFPSRNFGNIL